MSAKTAHELSVQLQKKAKSEKAQVLQNFFKTGPGEYSEGDIFLGVTVPITRKIAIGFIHLPLTEIHKSLKSKFHEVRFAALLILVAQYKKSNALQRYKIVDFYLKNTKYINNWDLVDLSADKILGAYFFNNPTGKLMLLAHSNNIWERRMSIIATFYFIKHDRFDETLRLATILLNDEHDLIHKAVGWMLREVGKRSLSALEDFLHIHYKNMPRTMLRYAIEHFPEKKRQSYLKGVIS